jgi:hypothetical protein
MTMTMTVASEACPEKSKPGPEGTKAAVVTFEEISDRMEATDLDANPKATEAAVERQELCNEELNVVNIGFGLEI